MKTSTPPTISDYLLVAACIASLTLNFVFLFLFSRPDLLRSVRLSFKRVPHITSSDHTRGTPEAGVTAIEYSDFLCHFCKELHANLKTLSNSQKFVWVFRNRPLAIHPLATRAAVAAECAGRQGRFWEYADSLFENQDQIRSTTDFDDLAERLNLNLAEFNSCQASGVVDLVNDQTEKADILEVNATPTTFINGKRFTGALPVDQLSRILVSNR